MPPKYLHHVIPVIEMRNNLRTARQQRGLTVAELARQTGLHPTTIFELEAGKRWPYPKYRRLLAQALGESVGSLFGRDFEQEGDDRR
jgi:transcriptional regulator with XRE-family HTH domain